MQTLQHLNYHPDDHRDSRAARPRPILRAGDATDDGSRKVRVDFHTPDGIESLWWSHSLMEEALACYLDHIAATSGAQTGYYDLVRAAIALVYEDHATGISLGLWETMSRLVDRALTDLVRWTGATEGTYVVTHWREI